MSVTLKKSSLYIKDGREYQDVSLFSSSGTIEKWLDNHPEATTSVQDGSITEKKLNSALSSKINGEINRSTAVDAQHNAQIATLSSRMDTFTKLPTGSTSGDAELKDIRVQTDGTIASTAGTAVRNQIDGLQDKIDNITKITNLFYIKDQTLNGMAVVNTESGVIFDGAVTKSTYFYVGTFKAGTYTANLSFEEGEINYPSHLNLRYGSGSGIRWVNVSVTPLTITFNEETLVFVAVQYDVVCSGLRVKIQINEGEIIDKYSKHMSAIDTIAREKIDNNYEEYVAYQEELSDIIKNYNYLKINNPAASEVNIITNQDGTYSIDGIASKATPFEGIAIPPGTYEAYIKIISGTPTGSLSIYYKSNNNNILWTTGLKKELTFVEPTYVFFRVNAGTYTNVNIEACVLAGKGLTAIDRESRYELWKLAQKETTSSINLPLELGGISLDGAKADVKYRIRSAIIPALPCTIKVNDSYKVGYRLYDKNMEIIDSKSLTTGGITYDYDKNSQYIAFIFAKADNSDFTNIDDFIEDSGLECIVQDYYVSSYHNNYINGYEEMQSERRKMLLQKGLQEMLSHNRETSCLNFALITDTHCAYYSKSYYSSENNIKLFSDACQYVDFGIHCGDIVVSTEMTRPSAIQEYRQWKNNITNVKCPIYVAKGNHELNQRYPTEDTFNYNTNYDNVICNSEFEQLTRNDRKKWLSNKNQPYGSYFYCDYDDYKIRVIVLNIYLTSKNNGAKHFGNLQPKWFAEEALDFTEKTDRSQWSVVVFIHAAEGNEFGIAGSILEAFMLGQEANISNINTSHFVTQGSMNVCGVFHGHNHDDLYTNEILGSTSHINNIGFDNSFTTIAASVAKKHYVLDELGTDNEYCVSFISIDTVNKIIYETRMGRNGYAQAISDPLDPTEGRQGYIVLPKDPNTQLPKVNRSFSYGNKSEDHYIITGIDDRNKNLTV